MKEFKKAIDKYIENIKRKGSNKEKLQYLANKYGLKNRNNHV